MMLLMDSEGKACVDKFNQKWDHLKYRIDHVLSCALAFELNLKTYDLFLRSSGFVLKKDPEGWERLTRQVELAKIIERETAILQDIQKATSSTNDKKRLNKERHLAYAGAKKDDEYQNLEGLGMLLPQVQESITAGPDTAYRMPHYFSKPFRTLMLKEGAFDPFFAKMTYGNILKEVRRCLYDFKAKRPITPEGYIKKHFYEKFQERLEKSKFLSDALLREYSGNNDTGSVGQYANIKALETLSKIFKDDYKTIYITYEIELNESVDAYYCNEQYGKFNASKRIKKINKDRTGLVFKYNTISNRLEEAARRAVITPPQKDIRLIHGDLHFDNIMIDSFDLEHPVDKLIDHGDFFIEGGDVAYDLGKLMHSFNGLYDFIHEGLFKLTWHTTPENELKCHLKITTNNHVFKNPMQGGGSGANLHRYMPFYGGEIVNYLYVSAHNEDIIKEVFAGFGDCEWLLKRAKFNEAMHFLTMAQFHIKDNPQRTLAIIITGLILMTQYIKEE